MEQVRVDFVAIDVETANPDLASICGIGIAFFCDGEVVFETESGINPQDGFSFWNVSIHGITPELVADSPLFPDVATPLFKLLSEATAAAPGPAAGLVVACHTPFDRMAIEQACAKYSLEPPSVTWLDTAAVARRAWPQCARRGYGLADVCSIIGHEFEHHDALEDAKACGHVLVAACAACGLSVDEWLVRVRQRITPRDSHRKDVSQEGNPDGPLAGEVIVFTGVLEAMTRAGAAEAAAKAGCQVVNGVTKQTTLLVVGDQDARQLAAGQSKSAKHRKAEELAANGHRLRILRETDFMELVRLGD